MYFEFFFNLIIKYYFEIRGVIVKISFFMGYKKIYW